jgi:hypothetical protein
MNRRIRNRTYGGVRGRRGNPPPTRSQCRSVAEAWVNNHKEKESCRDGIIDAEKNDFCAPASPR